MLIALAPLIAHRLDVVTERAQEQGVALVLDARLPPQDKLTLAPALLGGVEAERPARRAPSSARRATAATTRATERADLRPARRSAPTTCSSSAVGDAFRIAFVIAGGLALLAAAALARGCARTPIGRVARVRRCRGPARGIVFTGDRTRPPRHPRRDRCAGRGCAIGLPVVYAAVHAAPEPRAVAIQDPCKDRELPGTGGHHAASCRTARSKRSTAPRAASHSSREELVLALADEQAARRYEQRHGVDPRSLRSVLGNLIGP